MIGVAYPFNISNGMVSVTSDPAEIARSRVMFCLGTQVLERVMRPPWGVELMNSAMAVGGTVHEIVSEALEDAFRSWFPTYVLGSVETSMEDDGARVMIDVRYGRPDSDLDESARVGVAVPGGSEIFQSERSF